MICVRALRAPSTLRRWSSFELARVSSSRRLSRLATCCCCATFRSAAASSRRLVLHQGHALVGKVVHFGDLLFQSIVLLLRCRLCRRKLLFPPLAARVNRLLAISLYSVGALLRQLD